MSGAPSHGPLGAHVRPGGIARYVVTDRDGVRSTPSRAVRLDAAAGRAGSSQPPYDRCDLAAHVGDDPAAVIANRQAVAAAVGVGDVAFMDQVHGAQVTRVDAPTGEVAPTADALVTSTPGLALAVLVADCVPVVLADDDAGVVAVAHAGRRGIEVGVLPAVVDEMRALGARPRRTAAVIGPAICPACYEVPAAMRDEVAAVVPEARAVSRAGTPALHLRRAASAQLAAAGVGTVDAVGGCTAEDPTLYSYRRDGRTGRFAMLVWIPSLPGADR